MITYTKYSDSQLLKLHYEGDTNAFAMIFRKYWAPLVLHANNMIKEEDMAQDIVQDIFSRLISKSQGELEIRTSLKAYLYQSVKYEVMNIYHKEKTKFNYLESLAKYPDQARVSDVDVHLKELIALIDAEIENMPPKMKEIFLLSRRKHMTYREIGDLLNISEHTVNTQVQRALKALKGNPEIKNYLHLFALVILKDIS